MAEQQEARAPTAMECLEAARRADEGIRKAELKAKLEEAKRLLAEYEEAEKPKKAK